MTQAQKKDGAEKPDTESTGRPVHNIKLAFKDAAQKKLVKKLCNKGLHGNVSTALGFLLIFAPPRHC